MHMRFILICILGFAGFFRIGELLSIKIKDIIQLDNHLEITISKSKTDQLREGHVVYVARTGNRTCPHFWLTKYLKQTGLKKEDYLICRLAKTKIGHHALGQYSISYETARKTFLEHLAQVYPNHNNTIGLHSLRSGGASSAADKGVSDRLIGKHGRWSSNSCRDGYIKDNKKKRLTVSSALGL